MNVDFLRVGNLWIAWTAGRPCGDLDVVMVDVYHFPALNGLSSSMDWIYFSIIPYVGIVNAQTPRCFTWFEAGEEAKGNQVSISGRP